MAKLLNEDICRTCLNQDTNMLISVFREETIDSNSLTVANLLMEFTSVQVTGGDILPKTMCEECIEQLKKFYLFKKRCFESEQTLLSLVENSDTVISRSPENVFVKDESDEDNSDYHEEYYEYSNFETAAFADSLNFKLEETTEKTEKQSNNVEVYKCPKCEMPFKMKHNLKNHMASHDDDYDPASRLDIAKNQRTGPFCCTMCDKTFRVKIDLAEHMSTHVGSSYRCNICNKFYIREWALKKHFLLTHKYACKVCFTGFDSKDDLEKHKPEHKDVVLPYVCKECGKQFKEKRRLTLHMKVHTGERKFLCTICGKAFALAGNLNVHLRIHNGIKPFTCKICGKAFCQRNALHSHMVNHNKDDRQYVCQKCGSAFNRQATLRKHMIRHTGERKYACIHCDKRFFEHKELNDHIVVHTGVKKYSCEFCGKAFGRATNLSVHKKTHTGERPHVCQVCGRGFIQSHVLKSHMKTHINNEN